MHIVVYLAPANMSSISDILAFVAWDISSAYRRIFAGICRDTCLWWKAVSALPARFIANTAVISRRVLDALVAILVPAGCGGTVIVPITWSKHLHTRLRRKTRSRLKFVGSAYTSIAGREGKGDGGGGGGKRGVVAITMCGEEYSRLVALPILSVVQTSVAFGRGLTIVVIGAVVWR